MNNNYITPEFLAQEKPGEAWLVLGMDITRTREPTTTYLFIDLAKNFIFGQITTPDKIPTTSEFEEYLQNAYEQQGSWPSTVYFFENDPAIDTLEDLLLDKLILFKTVPRRRFSKFIRLIEHEVGTMKEKNKKYNKEVLKDVTPGTYDPCPCNSGKKFKFCCKPIFPEISEAMALVLKGRPKAALKYLDIAKNRVGETPELLCRYATVYHDLDKEKKEEYLTRALTLNPNHPRSNYIRGIMYSNMEDYEKAMEHYQIALKNYPPGDYFHLNELWNNIGSVYFQTDETDKAREAWETALTYIEDDEVTLNNLEMLDDIEDDDYYEATRNDLEMLDEIEDDDYDDDRKNLPIAAFGDLSINALERLLFEPLDCPDSIISFSETVKKDLFNNLVFYRNAIRALNLFQDMSPVKKTATGNLNRKFISMALKVSEGIDEERWRLHKVINEIDFFELHIYRIIFVEAGLISEQKTTFKITKKGIALLKKPDIELYTTLFKTLFYEIDLNYLSGYGFEIPEIYQAINFTFYMAQTTCKDWTSVEEFIKKIALHALTFEDINTEDNDDIKLEILIDIYISSVIKPMINFGLFEVEFGSDIEKTRIRATKLLHEFIKFKF